MNELWRRSGTPTVPGGDTSTAVDGSGTLAVLVTDAVSRLAISPDLARWSR